MDFPKIPTLSSYSDWLEKAEHDLSMFEKKYNVYDMANCFLSLNALPEWIKKTDNASENIRQLAEDKICIMKHHQLDIERLKKNDINNQLRFVRLFCNHAKHKKDKGEFIEISMGARLPATFPIKFEYLSIGENCSIKAVDLLKNVIIFWKKNI